MLLRHRIFEDVNLQLVAKPHGANPQMFLEKLIQVAASPAESEMPGAEINSKVPLKYKNFDSTYIAVFKWLAEIQSQILQGEIKR